MNLDLPATSGLAVRPWAPGDREVFAAMVADREMMRYITNGRPWRSDEVDEFLERQARHLRNHGTCMGALLHDDLVVGVAGIQPLDRAGDFEFGWWVARAHQGRGWATLVGHALVAYAFEVMLLDRVYAVIHPDNAASKRVAEKLGMHAEGLVPASSTNARRPDDPVLFYRLDRPA